MRFAAIASVWLATPALAHVTLPLTPGPYTDEEEVYFAKEAGKAAALWIGINVDADGKTSRFVDAFGREVPSPSARPAAACHIHMASAQLLEGDFGDGASMVISEWPDRAAALAFWNSPEYAEAKTLRKGVAECQVLLIEADTIGG